jgi:predicted Kef-type K+ transport protein
MTPFVEFGIVILTAAALGMLASILRQPPLIGYIITGLFLGPIGAAFIQNAELLKVFSEFGIALLLFVVGLELNWQSIKKVGLISAQLALVQIAVTILLGLGIGSLLDRGLTESLVIGLALSFSSTIVVLKAITGKNDIQSLYGKLAVGVLLVQDLIAVLLLILLPTLVNSTSGAVSQVILLLIGRIIVLIGAGWFTARFLLPGLWHRLAHNRELMLLCSIGWCFFMAIAAHWLGFSSEIGAFIAGLTLASTPYSEDISHGIRPLRDFFIVIFFVLLGFSVTPGQAIDWRLVSYLTLAAVLIKPLIIIPVMTRQHYRIRTSWLTGLSLGQLSEFSVILGLTAASLGLVSSTTVSALVIATALSLGLSSYLMEGAERLFSWLRPILMPLEHKGHFTDRHLSLEHVDKMSEHVIIFGYHRMGFHILRTLKRMRQEVLIVDFNPDIIDRLRHENVPSVFGDASDPDLMETVNVKQAKLLISTIPHLDVNLALISSVKRHRQVAIVVTASTLDEALAMYQAGADHVILPHFLSGEYIATMLEEYQAGNLKRFFAQKRSDAKLLKTKEHALYFD